MRTGSAPSCRCPYGAALFLIVRKYGFDDVLGPYVVLDPSRVAAQIVSGIDFIGGGLIFVRGDAVRALTTAAVIWLTAAIGMACGAGRWILAIAATLGHFVVAVAYPRLAARLPRSRHLTSELRIVYEDGRGALRDILEVITHANFVVAQIATHRRDDDADGRRSVAVTVRVQGRLVPTVLVDPLLGVPGVIDVAERDLSADVS